MLHKNIVFEIVVIRYCVQYHNFKFHNSISFREIVYEIYESIFSGASYWTRYSVPVDIVSHYHIG